MSIVGAALTPHPPVLLPEVGHGRERMISATHNAMSQAAGMTAGWNPDVIIIVSPHTVMYEDYFHISPGSEAEGDMSAFGAPQVRIRVNYDAPLRDEIIRRAQSAGLSAGTLGMKDPALDHGVLIPMYFLRKAGICCPVVRIGLSGFSPQEHYHLGMCIAGAASALGRRAAFIASGDMSHKLTRDGPYGFAPEGPVFDRTVAEALSSADFMKILTIDPSLCERAAECGLRSIQIMAGALDGLSVMPRLLSSEGPFGVGYTVAVFDVTGTDETRKFILPWKKAMQEKIRKRRAGEDAWVRLARFSLETYIRSGKKLLQLPNGLPEELIAHAAGAFVSLHLNGRLRGCIGTIEPAYSSVALEIVNNAVSAGVHDPRFPPVRQPELEDLEYSVDVLGRPEPVKARDQLNPKKYGVIVSCGRRRGLLLPDLDGVDTVQQQLEIALAKGRIREDEPYSIERFEVVRHT